MQQAVRGSGRAARGQVTISCLLPVAAGLDHGAMSLPTLTARVRTVWESLAGVPVGFAPVLRVAASPRSGLRPPSWVGLVVIAGTAIATAPDARTAQIVQQALGTVATASLTEPEVLSGELVIADMLGPATLAYFDGTVFHPPPGPATTEAVDASDPETYPGGIGDPANIGIQTRGRILCAHADPDGQGMHWKLPGQACTARAERNAETEAGQ
jgi:hypothetical protein